MIQHFWAFQTVLLKTLSPQYFIKIKKTHVLWYLYRPLFVGNEAFDVQLQADFSQFSSGSC